MRCDVGVVAVRENTARVGRQTERVVELRGCLLQAA